MEDTTFLRLRANVSRVGLQGGLFKAIHFKNGRRDGSKDGSLFPSTSTTSTNSLIHFTRFCSGCGSGGKYWYTSFRVLLGGKLCYYREYRGRQGHGASSYPK
jgi:hypothetical protein